MEPKTEKTQAFVQSSPTQEEMAALAQEDLTGKPLGDFHILRQLGQGGMGQVYLARQASLNREVALKFLRPELAANKVSLQRFKKEAESIGRVTHSNIVHIYGIYEVEGHHFMALEYVEGRNLREYMERKRVIDVRTGLNIMGQVAAALQRASELGIVHRDIKPENILLTKKEEVKVADFGLSRCFLETGAANHLTQSNVTMGTPLYMSPEQVEGKKTIDQRSDIYSFGVTCYHMFAGHPPFRGESAFEVAVQHVQKEAPPLAEIRPDLPTDIILMVQRMMAKNPEARYQTAGEVVRDVGRLRDAIVAMSSGATPSGLILQRSSAEALQALSGSQTLKRRRSLALWLGLPMLLLAAAAVGLGLGWWWENHSPPAPDPKLFAEAKPKAPKREEPRRLLPAIDPLHLKGLEHIKDKELDAADEIFARALAQDPRTPIAILGKAMVLALQNKPDESNELFRRVLLAKTPTPIKNFQPWRKAYVLEMIAEALRFNHLNSPKTFPAELERYRVPPEPTLIGK